MSTLFIRQEDALLVAETARRWLAEEYTSDASGQDAGIWAAMADLGWHGVALPESHGGLGLPAAAALALAEECGRGLVREPVVASSIVAAALVGSALAPQAADDLAAGIVAGERTAVVLGLESPIAATAEGLTGIRRHVPGADIATDVLAVVREADGNTALCRLNPVPALRGYRSVDGRVLSDVVLAAAPAIRLAEGPVVEAALDRARALARAALAAEAIGAMDRCLEITADYLQERHQFGQSLARFQALRHRMADMFVDAELARTMAAMLLGPDGASPDPRLADRALATLTTAARTIGERAIQLHGGMGMTEAMTVGRYFKRLLYLSVALGGETAPRQRVAEELAAAVEANTERSAT
jgi:alkylation response protein AidB-like acyl-CoA dehydrogenase